MRTLLFSTVLVCLWHVSLSGLVLGAHPNVTYLLLSQQSTQSYCSVRHCIKDHIRPYWTIHGLWPSGVGRDPAFCDRTDHFNPDLVADLRESLDAYWPSISSKNSVPFWEHEWAKHGTCAKAIGPLSGQHKYFATTIALYRSMNATSLLEAAQILPSKTDTVSVSDIEHAFVARLAVQPALECFRSKLFEYPILSEVHLCLTPQLKPRKCPSLGKSCGKDRIYYF